MVSLGRQSISFDTDSAEQRSGEQARKRGGRGGSKGSLVKKSANVVFRRFAFPLSVEQDLQRDLT